MHLHARSLSVQHPITKEMMTFTAPLPEHMARTGKLLDWNEKDVPADPIESLRRAPGRQSVSGPRQRPNPVMAALLSGWTQSR